MRNKTYKLSESDSIWKCAFYAMASPCEVLFRTDSSRRAKVYSDFVYKETKRIESQFSRYLRGNIVHKINNAKGKKVEVDDETARMIDFAHQCYNLSDELFDVTSGVLRNCWRFDGSEQSPDKTKLTQKLSLVGWDKICWENPLLQLREGMEIDFGGIGKEYAVDRVAENAITFEIESVMVNFGGDIRAINQDNDTPPWVIGIENPDNDNSAIGTAKMSNGGIATSGDSRRFCFHNGKRLGHILNPKTGWPIQNAPHSVTVISTNCTEAGIIATMAMLQGAKAEQFLEMQKITFHCIR